MNQQKILVTSALPYANGPIHFGHITGAYLPADIFVRFHRMQGRDIIYIGGTDDHGVPITISAEARGVTPAQHVAENHALIKSIFDRMNISFDNFSQTSRQDPHYPMTQEFYKRLDELGHIEKITEEQYFCADCGRFLADRYISGTCPHCGHVGARGDECGGCGRTLDPSELKAPLCKVCGHTPVMKPTANWYLKLGDFADWLQEWIGGKPDWRPMVVNEVRKYLDQGLHTRPITRDLRWGIPIPTDDPEAADKVIYVWFDAPIGYVSSTIEYFRARGQEDRWKEFWKPASPGDVRLIHFIGKDNIFFHAIMFPIMCHGQDNGWKIVDNVPANAFLNLEGKQFSKSEGWYIDPLDFFSRYPVDSARYYLCSIMPEQQDTEFRWDDYGARHNELANVYGNIVHRALSFTAKNYETIPAYDGTRADALDVELIDAAQQSATMAAEAIDAFQFRRALDCVMDMARACHKYIDTAAPWTAVKEDRARGGNIMHTCIRLIRGMAVVSYPFMPETAEKIWAMIGETQALASTHWNKAFAGAPAVGHALAKPEILFTRLEKDQIEAEKEKLAGFAKAMEARQSKVEAIKPPRPITDFQKWDLRVGTITAAEPVPKSNKMMQLRVHIGIEERTVMAGIAKTYKAEDLPGQRIILVANLEPKKLMGVESQGMVLCANFGDEVRLLHPEGNPPDGARVS